MNGELGGIFKKFKDLKFEPFATTELDNRTILLANELEKVKRETTLFKGELWVLKQKLKEAQK